MTKQDKILKALNLLSEDELAYINDGFKPKKIDVKFIGSNDKVTVWNWSALEKQAMSHYVGIVMDEDFDYPHLDDPRINDGGDDGQESIHINPEPF